MAFIQRTSSGQHSWRAMSASADGTKILAAADNSGPLSLSTNSGVTWTAQSPGSGEWRAAAMDPTGTYLLAAGDTATGVYTSSDGGSTWTLQSGSVILGHAPSTNWDSAAVSANGQYMVLGEQAGDVWTSSDHGTTWINRMGGNYGARDWAAVAIANDGQTIYAGTGPFMLVTHNASSWAVHGDAPGAKSIAIDPTGTIVVATSTNTIVRSTNSGASFAATAFPTPGSSNYRSVAMTPDGLGIAAGSDGNYVYTSTDGGTTYTQQTSSGQRNWYGVTLSSDGAKIAAADNNNGYIWTYATPYTVTYNGNTSTSGSQTDGSSPYNGGSNVTVLNAGSLVKTSYTFVGWNTAANGSGTSYAVSSTISNIQANVTLYAQWTATIPTTIDGSNSTVTGTKTWGDGSSVALTVSGVVQAGATLTLDIPNLGALTGAGNHIEVKPGGSLVLGTKTVVAVDGQPYKVNGH